MTPRVYIFCASHEGVTLDLTYLNPRIGRKLGHGRSPVALVPASIYSGELELVACLFGTWDQKSVLSPPTNNSLSIHSQDGGLGVKLFKTSAQVFTWT